jgi:hypothetical protein
MSHFLYRKKIPAQAEMYGMLLMVIYFSTLQRSIYWKIHPPPGGESADVIWGKKYEKVKRKRGKM